MKPSMRALISCSPGLPLLIILDRAIHGCSAEKRRTRSVLCVQDQCPNLPKVTGKEKRREKASPRRTCHVPFGVLLCHLFTVAFGKDKLFFFLNQLGAKVG